MVLAFRVMANRYHEKPDNAATQIWYDDYLTKNNSLFIWSSALRKTCSYSELFYSVFSRIRTEYEEIRSISPSVRMRENTDQNNSEYGHFLRRVAFAICNGLVLAERECSRECFIVLE